MAQKAVEKLFYHLDHRPEAQAFSLGDETMSFGELDEQARRYAGGLVELGVKKGDRVVSILESSLELVQILVGHHRLGAIHVPVNTRYRRKEIEHIINDAAPRAVVVGAEMEALPIIREIELPESVEAVVVVGAGTDEVQEGELFLEDVVVDEALQNTPAHEEEDPALFIYTSGTTGPSKGVVHTFKSVVSGIDALTAHWRWTTEDRLILALPLFHVHGLCIGIHGTLIRGNQTEIHSGFDAEKVARAVGASGSIFMGVPTMHTRLVEVMEEDEDLAQAMSKARLITSGSAALRPDIFAAYERLTGHRILERYGMSETMLTISNDYEGERRRGSVGRAVPGTEIRIVDEDQREVEADEVGEILVRGASVMKGYWGLPEKTEEAFTEDGYFRTGDVARRDEEGFIYIAGRRSVDIIKSGGFKISAREIEEVLREHKDVRDVGVVGLLDEEWGQKIACAVVPEPGVEFTAEKWLSELRKVAKGELAEYKMPREIAIYKEGLPRNALGKVQKHRIISAFTT